MCLQQCDILTSVDSDEHVQPLYKLETQNVAGLSLCWSYIPHCWKSHVMAQMYLLNKSSVYKNAFAHHSKIAHLYIVYTKTIFFTEYNEKVRFYAPKGTLGGI